MVLIIVITAGTKGKFLNFVICTVFFSIPQIPIRDTNSENANIKFTSIAQSLNGPEKAK